LRGVASRYRVLGLDLSVSASGWCFLAGSHVEGIGTIKPLAEDDGMLSRQIEIASEIESIIIRYRPDYIYVEDVYYARNPKTYKTLVALQSLVVAGARRRRSRVVLKAPSSWRRLVGIAGKSDVKDRVSNGDLKFKVKFKPTMDALEAALIALAGQYELSGAKDE